MMCIPVWQFWLLFVLAFAAVPIWVALAVGLVRRRLER